MPKITHISYVIVIEDFDLTNSKDKTNMKYASKWFKDFEKQNDKKKVMEKCQNRNFIRKT